MYKIVPEAVPDYCLKPEPRAAVVPPNADEWLVTLIEDNKTGELGPLLQHYKSEREALKEKYPTTHPWVISLAFSNTDGTERFALKIVEEEKLTSEQVVNQYYDDLDAQYRAGRSVERPVNTLVLRLNLEYIIDTRYCNVYMKSTSGKRVTTGDFKGQYNLPIVIGFENGRVRPFEGMVDSASEVTMLYYTVWKEFFNVRPIEYRTSSTTIIHPFSEKAQLFVSMQMDIWFAGFKLKNVWVAKNHLATSQCLIGLNVLNYGMMQFIPPQEGHDGKAVLFTFDAQTIIGAVQNPPFIPVEVSTFDAIDQPAQH